jgi:TP901 family phage tail tape measure protein
VDDRIVAVGLTVNTAQYVAGMNKASAAAAKTTAATQQIGTSVDKTKSSMLSFKNIALYAFGYGVAAGVVKVGQAAVRTLMEFEDAMAALGAASMASAEDLEAMREAALQAGRDTVFTGVEAANAMTELAKAGVSTADILGGALTGALDLAAAGQVDVAFAAETAATAMVQFNIAGSDMSYVADLLAAGAGKAQGGVQELALALRQGGQVASMVGWDFEDTTTALTAFAAAGLLGSDAGTSLKTMLLRLSSPTNKAREEMQRLGLSVYDSNGNMVGAADLAGQLTAAFGSLEPQARNAAMGIIFGTDAVRAANVLYANGQAGIEAWTREVNDSGYAAEQAARKNDTLSGDLNRLRGTLEAVINDEGEGMLLFLRDLVQFTDDAVNAFQRFGNAWDANMYGRDDNGDPNPGPFDGMTLFDLAPEYDNTVGAAMRDFFARMGRMSADPEAWGDLGISTEATRAMAANMEAYAAAQKDASVESDYLMLSSGKLYDTLAAQEGRAAAAALEIEEMEDAAREAADEIDAMKDAILGLGETYTDIEAAQDAVTSAQIRALRPLQELEDARKDLTEAQKDLAEADSDASREGAQEAVTRAEQAVAAAEAAITLKGNSEAALENRDNLRAMAGEIKVASAELLDLDKSGYTSRAEMERGRVQFIKVAEQLGYTTEEAEAYADQLGLIPGEVPTRVYINGYDEAMRRAQNIARAISGIERNVAISVVTTEIRRDAARASASTSGIQPARKDGGWVSGPGGPRSDSIRAWL